MIDYMFYVIIQQVILRWCYIDDIKPIKKYKQKLLIQYYVLMISIYVVGYFSLNTDFDCNLPHFSNNLALGNFISVVIDNFADKKWFKKVTCSFINLCTLPIILDKR